MPSYKGYVWDGSQWSQIGSNFIDTSVLETSLPLPPIGSVNQFAGTTAPSRWLLCAGQAISRASYSQLFSVLSTNYGSGDGSTTFNLPDLRGRVIAGLDNMGGSDAGRLDWANTLGTASGAQTHTLSTTEMPSHTHTQNAHDHTYPNDFGYTNSANGGWFVAYATSPQSPAPTGSYGGGTTSSTTATNQNTGGGGAHNNMQPTMLMNYIIRAL